MSKLLIGDCMKLWLLSISNNKINYGMFDSAVVAAETEKEARMIHPRGEVYFWSVLFDSWCQDCHNGLMNVTDTESGWDRPENLECQLLGEAVNEIKSGVICASFNE